MGLNGYNTYVFRPLQSVKNYAKENKQVIWGNDYNR